MPAATAKKWTEYELYKLIELRCPRPAWATFPSVRNSTGYAKRQRIADALSMSLWPSRGLELHGFEIKVSRGDWAKEKADPEKAEEIAQYCHRWWMVTPAGLVKTDELPPAWGLLEADAAGKKLVAVREAGSLEAKALSVNFVASLLRATDESYRALLANMVSRDSIQDQIDDACAVAVQSHVSRSKHADERSAREVEDLHKAIAAFKDKSGIAIDQWSAGRIGTAVKLILDINGSDSRLELVKSYLLKQAEEARKLAASIESVCAGSGKDV